MKSIFLNIKPHGKLQELIEYYENRLQHQTYLHSAPLGDENNTTRLRYMRAAIAMGSDVNELDATRSIHYNHGRPLHCVLDWRGFRGPDNIEILQFLLDQGADPRLQDRHGMTPLQIARGTLRGNCSEKEREFMEAAETILVDAEQKRGREGETPCPC
jgi:hypothetical protein